MLVVFTMFMLFVVFSVVLLIVADRVSRRTRSQGHGNINTRTNPTTHR